jgi:hypothetical protein
MWYRDFVNTESPEIEAKFLRHQIKDLRQLKAGIRQVGLRLLDDEISTLQKQLEKAERRRRTAK